MKRPLQEVLLDLFEEQQDLFVELLSELIEDAGLVQIIKEGEETKYVDIANAHTNLQDKSKITPITQI